jgi:MinD superfamily P-loop ATPase
MRELVVISGKGGTGKTSIAASFAALAGRAVIADCDVDSSNLPLLLEPEDRIATPFFGGKQASIDTGVCSGCGLCEEVCRFGAVVAVDDEAASFRVDPLACEGCGVCAHFCPEGAVAFEDVQNGEWYLSRTRFGLMIHARLAAGGENSGRLVSVVRTEARSIAEQGNFDLIISDGSPGIGCPVIASITGADFVLAVTEPSLSAIHDLERVVSLTGHFGVETAIAINKSDINAGLSAVIEKYARERGIMLAGKIRYDTAVTKAQMEGKTIVEYADCPAARDIRDIWECVHDQLKEEDVSYGT